MVVNEVSSYNTCTSDAVLFNEPSVRVRPIGATPNLLRVLSMSQPIELVQPSPNNRKRKLLLIIGLILIAALSLIFVYNPSLSPQTITTLNTCQQYSTIVNYSSTTTINNCQQNQFTGPPPFGGVTSASFSASSAVTKLVTVTQSAPSTHEFHPKLTGEGNVGSPDPSIGDPPALASPNLISGAISIVYGDGSPMVLSTSQVTLTLCAASCVSVPATLKQTGPGRYTYTFTPPSLTGTITVYLPAQSLADEWGRIFPSIDTQIGTYANTPTTTTGSTTAVATTTGTTAAVASTAVNPLTGQAVNTINPQTQTFPIEEFLAVLIVLALAGVLLILPLKHPRGKKIQHPN